MPNLLNKIKNRWNASSSEAPSYHIGPITPANHRRWRHRLAKLLGINGTTPLRTASYRPLYQSWFCQPRDLPPFSFETIHSMLMDPGIRLNLAMRAAPIYGVQFAYPAGTDAAGKTIYQNGVQAANPAVAAWVQRQLNTIWHNDLPAILRSQVYGWVGGEVSLRLSGHNLIEIDKLVARHPGDIRLLKLDGERYGVKVLRVQEGGEVNLEFPSAWFHAFRPDDGEDYGTSILLGAYSPCADKWFNGGALDTRRLFMHKDAYGGMKIAYPEEEIYIGNELNPVSARDIAAQMVEQRKTGGTTTYPSTLDNQGNPKWRVEEATTANNPQHILQYPKDCDDEIRVGMEIPDDVISHDGLGAWAGKRIPLAAFYAGLDTWVVQILADLRKTLEPLILLNWGKAEDFEICHKPLALQAMEAVAPQAPAAPGAQGAQGAQPGRLSPEIMGVSGQRMSLRSDPNTTPHAHSGQARARAIAALLTRIYGPDAESYFDEAYGIESSSDSRHDSDHDPYEFRRLSSYVSRPTSFHRIPWDESKHPRGRDGRFIEKYSADALTHTQQRISESLAPNHIPTTGRTSDDLRGLLDHFNLLDDTQVNTLLDQHKVAPDSTGTNPLTRKLHRQIYGEESPYQKLPARNDIKPQLQDGLHRYSDDKQDGSPFTLLAHHPEGEKSEGTEPEAKVAESQPDAPKIQGETEPQSSKSSENSDSKVIGISDVPQDIRANLEGASEGDKLSGYIRQQHQEAFKLAEQIQEAEKRLEANSKRIAALEEELNYAPALRRVEINDELRGLRLQNGMLTRDRDMFVERLKNEFGDLELPGFTFINGDLERITVPGGTGAQAVLDRIARDHLGYGTSVNDSSTPGGRITRHHDDERIRGNDPRKNIADQEVPDDFYRSRYWESEGRLKSQYARHLNKDAFQIADQVIDTATKIAETDEAILSKKNALAQLGDSDSDASRRINEQIHELEMANEVRRRDTQQLVNNLQEKYGDIEIPEFKYRSWKGEFHVAGGTGAQAIIDRALRDRDGYEERFENPALESVSDFEIASPLARGIRTRAGSILKEVIVEGSKRLVQGSTEQSESVEGPPPLPIPDPSHDSSKVGSQASASSKISTPTTEKPKKIVYSGTDGPVDFNRPGGSPGRGRVGGTHVTTYDLTDRVTLYRFSHAHIPGSTPKRLTEIEVSEEYIQSDPTLDIHPHTGWLPPYTTDAKILREWNIDWKSDDGPILTPIPAKK